MRYRVECRGDVWAVVAADGDTALDGIFDTRELAAAVCARLNACGDAEHAPFDASLLTSAGQLAPTSPAMEKIDRAAQRAEPWDYSNPDQKKGRVRLHGLIILIENPRGSWRGGVSPEGNPWSTELQDHYGEIARSEGCDRDPVDVFIGPHPESEQVFIVDQVDKNGRFDEHKVVLGALDEADAQGIYLRNFEPGWTGLGAIVQMDLAAFKEWLRDADMRCPASPTLAPDVPPRVHAGDAEGDADTEVCCDDLGDWELLGDDATGLRIRQRMTRADARNRNNRVYPRDVLQAAIDAARPAARAGAMLSTKKHPSVAVVGGVEHFIDAPEKTARVDDFSDVQADGWVYCDRTILPTAEGDEIAAKVRQGIAPGISTRFKMKGKDAVVQGQHCRVATWMGILSVDDVPNPAVDGAGAFELLSDAERHTIGAEERDPMNKFATLAGALWALLATRAAVDAVQQAKTELDAEFQEVIKAGGDVSAASKTVLEIDAAMSAAGYRAGAAAPSFTPANLANGNGGYAPEALRLSVQGGPGIAPQHELPTQEGDGISKADIEFVRATVAAAKQAASDNERSAAIRTATDAAIAKLSGFEQSAKDAIAKVVVATAASADAVQSMVEAMADAISATVARDRLTSRGMALGQTVRDPAMPGAAVTRESHSCMEAVDQILAASDAIRRRASGEDLTPDDLSRRAYNKKFVHGLMGDWLERTGKSRNVEEFMAATDSDDNIVTAAMDSMFQVGQQAAKAAVDSSTLSTMYNQPLIMIALLVQCFQDMRGLQFVEGIGPGLDRSDGMGGWTMRPNGEQGLSSVFRIPVEYYVPPTSGYAMYSGPLNDGGLLVPENTAIPEGQVKTTWLEFGPAWRRIGFSTSSDLVAAMGNGPLNYPVVARHLYHIAQHKARVIDHALFEEMLDISDRYAYTTVTTESQNLANNTKFTGAGSVSVNLNPTKLAKDTIVPASDRYITYGANAVGACRLLTGSPGTGSPYCGSALGYGGAPLMRPYSQPTMTAAGVYSASTVLPITVAAPALAVEGMLDVDGNIVNPVGGATATYAVDYENGVIVFKSGVTDNAGVIAEAITVTYSYTTNYDNFYLRFVNNANATLLATGETELAYWSRLLAKIDSDAAMMGMAPRFMAPNLGIMDLIVASKITAATTFYKLNSPDGTNLGPTGDFFASRNGINLARHNTPWRAGSQRLLLTRRGSTKYAIDTPMRVVGPVQKYDVSTLQAVAGQIWYLEENSAQFTPQVKNQAGAVLNPPSYSIKLW